MSKKENNNLLYFGGGLALLYLLTRGSGSETSGGGGWLGGYITDEGGNTTKDTKTKTDDTSVTTKGNGKTDGNGGKTTPDRYYNPWALVNTPTPTDTPAPAVTSPNNPNENFPWYRRAFMAGVTGGATEVFGLTMEAARENVRPPWWSFIFPPITWPIGLAVATHQSDEAKAVIAGQGSVGGGASGKWTLIPAPAGVSQSTELAALGVVTPATALTYSNGQTRYTAEQLNVAEDARMSDIQARIDAGTLRRSTGESILAYHEVKYHGASSYDYGGGAAAFPGYDRTEFDRVGQAYQTSPNTILYRMVAEMNRNRQPGTRGWWATPGAGGRLEIQSRPAQYGAPNTNTGVVTGNTMSNASKGTTSSSTNKNAGGVNRYGGGGGNTSNKNKKLINPKKVSIKRK